MKFLIVDDDPTINFITYDFLKENGHVSDTAATIDGAKSALLFNNYDIVLCDIYFSGQPIGSNLVSWVEENNIRVAIFLITNLPKLLWDDTIDYIEKPLDRDKLSVIIEKTHEHNQIQ